VPRTRYDVDRNEKVAQLVDAAVERLRQGGYEALSVAAISRDLGVAQNAVYWYFPTRDHLFVAAIDRMVESILASKPAEGSMVDHVVRFVERLDTSHGVLASLYMRARVSPVVAEYEASFLERRRALLRQVVAALGVRENIEETVGTLLCTIEGALLLGLSPETRERVIRWAFARLVG
jgi:AcrR family transcriptional regulator